MDHYLKKLRILQRILANYRREMQALAKKNPKIYREILDERKALIVELKHHPYKIPQNPLEKLQQHHIDQLIQEIQTERKSSNRFLN